MTTTDTNKPATYTGPLGFLDKLHDEQRTWDQTLYNSANEKLLALLSDCLKAYNTLRNDRFALKALAQKLTDLGIKHNAGTHLTAKVVRYVFRIINSRANAYARVLRSAIDAKKQPDELAAWVTAEGGIEAVRRKAKDGPSRADLIEKAADALESTATLATIKVRPTELTPDAEHKVSVALVRTNSAGEAEIVWGSGESSIVRNVLSLIAKKVLAQHDGKTRDEREQDVFEKRTAALAAAAANANANPADDSNSAVAA